MNKKYRTKYKIEINYFKKNINRVLNNLYPLDQQIRVKKYTPRILVDNGIKNLPMLITAKHIKSTIYTYEQAKHLGLPIGKGNNYHGLGKTLLIKAIKNMERPEAIYQHTGIKYKKNNYVIITSIKDNNGNKIIIPIEVEAKGSYNNVMISENQIKSVYGKENIERYIIKNKMKLIYIKEKITFNEKGPIP